jgi:hypothetical protein
VLSTPLYYSEFLVLLCGRAPYVEQCWHVQDRVKDGRPAGQHPLRIKQGPAAGKTSQCFDVSSTAMQQQTACTVCRRCCSAPGLAYENETSGAELVVTPAVSLFIQNVTRVRGSIMLCQARPARHSRSQRSSARACAVLLASLAVIGSLVQHSDAARPAPTPGRKLSQLLPTPDPTLPPAVPVFPPVLPTVGAGIYQGSLYHPS